MDLNVYPSDRLADIRRLKAVRRRIANQAEAAGKVPSSGWYRF
jgi:hypothetical protein